MTEDRKKQNLVVRVENGQLVIRIGVETLAFAADNSDLFNPFNEDKNDWVRKFKVINDLEWADDIARELAC